MSVECEGEAPQTRDELPGKDGALRVRVSSSRNCAAESRRISPRCGPKWLPLTLIGAVLVAMSGIYVSTTFNQNLEHEAGLRANAAGEVLAHAAQRVGTPDEMEPILSAIGSAPNIGDVAIAGRDGTIVASSHPQWHGKSIAAIAATLAGARAAARHPVAVETQRQLTGAGDYNGDYAVWLDLPRTGEQAVAIVRIDMARLAGGLTSRAWNTMTWLTITAILAILTVSMLVHRIVVAPIEALRDYARDYRRGAAETPQHGDEIGIVERALAASFHAAADSEARLASIASTDGLTGLGNRSFFKARFAEAIAEAERRSGLVGMMILNLDGFKDINDTLGHDAGDLVLQRTADILRGCSARGRHRGAYRRRRIRYRAQRHQKRRRGTRNGEPPCARRRCAVPSRRAGTATGVLRRHDAVSAGRPRCRCADEECRPGAVARQAGRRRLPACSIATSCICAPSNATRSNAICAPPWRGRS